MVGSGTVHFSKSTGSPEFKFRSSIGSANAIAKTATVYNHFYRKKKPNKTTEPTNNLLKTIIWLPQEKYRLKEVQTAHGP